MAKPIQYCKVKKKKERKKKIFPHFVVIHTVKGFGTINKAEVDVKKKR